MAERDLRIGDKVQLTTGAVKIRGVVEQITKASVSIRTAEGDLIRGNVANLRNYSNAARQAWKKMPTRKVGRPKGSSRGNRVSVTLRLDGDLWAKFLTLERAKLLPDRSALFNSFLKAIAADKERSVEGSIRSITEGKHN